MPYQVLRAREGSRSEKKCMGDIRAQSRRIIILKNNSQVEISIASSNVFMQGHRRWRNWQRSGPGSRNREGTTLRHRPVFSPSFDIIEPLHMQYYSVGELDFILPQTDLQEEPGFMDLCRQWRVDS